MKKIYKQYTVQKRKNGKHFILGIDEEYKAVKVEECSSEDEANNKRTVYQKRSKIYYDVHFAISNTITNYKAKLNKADIITTEFNNILELVLNEYKQNLIRKRVLVSNIINKSIDRAHEGSELNILTPHGDKNDN